MKKKPRFPGASEVVSDRIVHVIFDRMRRHLEAHDFLHLQFDEGIDLVVVEDAAGGQELAVLVEAFKRFA